MTPPRRSATSSPPASGQHAVDSELRPPQPPPSRAGRSGSRRRGNAGRFFALAQATGQMVWTTTPTGSMVDASSWCAFTGQTPEQVRRRHWLDAVHPDDYEHNEWRWERVVAGDTPVEVAWRIRRRDGVYRPFEIRIVPVRALDGSVREWVCAAADITARRQLEAALDERGRQQLTLREHERVLLESISDGFLAVDKTGLLTYVNAHVEQVLGKEREQLVGRNVRDLFPEVLAAPFFRAYEQVLAEGIPTIFEAYYPPLGMWFETRMYPAADGVTAFLNDSTGRRQAAEQIAESLAREQAAHSEAEYRRAEAEAAREQAETASHHLRQLEKVTDTALSHLALADLVPAVLGRICAVMEVDSAAILLFNEDRQELTVYAGRGALEREPVRIPTGRGVAGRIAASRQPLIVDDLSAADLVRPSLRDELRVLAGVPLLVEGQRSGVLLVGAATARQFSEVDIRLLQLVGDRIALAIDHVQLYELAQAGYAEAEARASELAATFAAMTDGVLVVDRQGRQVRSNQAFRLLLGLDPSPDADEIPPQDSSSLLDIRDTQGQPVPPERLPTARILRDEVLQGPTAMDLTMRTLDGRIVEANVTGAPVRTTEEGIVGAVAVYREITERRKLERRTRDALQALLAMAEALVGVGDAGGASTTADTNAAIRRLAALARSVLGCERMSFVALEADTDQIKPILRVGWPVEVEQQWNAQGGLFRLQDFVSETLIGQLRAGEVVVNDSSNTAPPGWPVPGVGNVLLAPLRTGTHLIGLFALDYGARPHQYTLDERSMAGAVAQLSAAVIERERLVREREAAQTAELASREATRRMELFMAIAGHEFRTPLTVIKGYLQLADQYLGSRLPEGELAAPLARSLQLAREALAQAQAGAQRMTGLLDDLLQVSRAQAGKLSMRPGPCDLINIVSNTVDEQRRMNPRRRIRLHLPRAGRAPVLADPDRIGQVVTNFLTNADKYSPQDQPVDVRIRVVTHTVRVSIRDQGQGLSPTDQEAIWERFYQAPGVQRQFGSDPGLGLGLYVCRTIVEQHEGRVGVASVVGEGSTFWFTLPLSPNPL